MTDPLDLDARGLLCPLPVLRLRKALAGLAPGAQVRLIASDPMAVVDVPHFCEAAGHVMLEVRELPDGARAFTVERGKTPDAVAGGDVEMGI